MISENAPDDQLFYDFSVGYSERNPMIWNGGFPEGVTRGWEWYQIWGGMQDWAYLWRGEHHVTIEVSSDKNPPYAEMDVYWEDNREVMLWWIGRSLTGIHGLVRYARNSAPLDAVVTVGAMDSPNFARTDPDVGDYHRVIATGSYSLTASADAYLPQSYSLAVIDDAATYQDFALCPVAGWTVSGTVTQAETGLPLEATVEFVGAPVTLTTSPEDGFYAEVA